MSEHKDLLPCVQYECYSLWRLDSIVTFWAQSRKPPPTTDTGGGDDEEERSWRVGSGELNLDTGYEELEEGRTNS